MRNPTPMAAVPPGPYGWHEFRGADGTTVYRAEAAKALQHWEPDVTDGEPLPKISTTLLSLRLAEYRKLVARAKKGQAVANDWKPAGVHPVVWELRMSYGGEEFRFYFSEPPSRPLTMVALLAHHKDLSLSADAIKDEQTALIKEATGRYNLGVFWQWGLDAVSESDPPQLDHYPRRI